MHSIPEICGMRILVVAATQQEIAPFVNSCNIDTLVCGVGIPFTVYHLTKRLLEDKFDLVIQAGIAGSFSKRIKTGDVVVVEQDTFADIGAAENKKFKTLFELGFGNENEFPFTNGSLINNSAVLKITDLDKVKAVTINTITGRKKQNKIFKKKFNAAIETMEGAAFHLVCLQQHIPFLQLRSISNNVGERDKTKWKINEAIHNLNIELLKLTGSLLT